MKTNRTVTPAEDVKVTGVSFWGSKVESTTKPRNDVWKSRGLWIVLPAMKQEEFNPLTFSVPLFLLLSIYYMIVSTLSRFAF